MSFIAITAHARDRYRLRWCHGGSDASVEDQMRREIEHALLHLRVSREKPPEAEYYGNSDGTIYCWTANRRKIFCLRQHFADERIACITVLYGQGAREAAA